MEGREIAAVIGIVIALGLGAAGLYIGLDAKNSSASDEELAQQVQEELTAAKGEAKKAGEAQSAATKKAAKKGKRAEKKAKSTASTIETLNGEVTKLKDQVETLNTQVSDLQAEQKKLRDDLNQDVAKLQTQLHKKQNK